MRSKNRPGAGKFLRPVDHPSAFVFLQPAGKTPAAQRPLPASTPARASGADGKLGRARQGQLCLCRNADDRDRKPPKRRSRQPGSRNAAARGSQGGLLGRVALDLFAGLPPGIGRRHRFAGHSGSGAILRCQLRPRQRGGDGFRDREPRRHAAVGMADRPLWPPAGDRRGTAAHGGNVPADRLRRVHSPSCWSFVFSPAARRRCG